MKKEVLFWCGIAIMTIALVATSAAYLVSLNRTVETSTPPSESVDYERINSLTVDLIETITNYIDSTETIELSPLEGIETDGYVVYDTYVDSKNSDGLTVRTQIKAIYDSTDTLVWLQFNDIVVIGDTE